MLKRYADVPLDSETSIKDCEHDFEKFYFISMVRLLLIYLRALHAHDGFFFLTIFTWVFYIRRNIWLKDVTSKKPP